MFTKELLESKDCLIIYHKEDNDGLLSAAILGNAIANAKNLGGEPGTYSGVSYYGTNYSELSAWVKAKANGEQDSPLDDILESFDALVITDISFNEPDAMLALKQHYGKSFLWIDHHAPAIERANEIGYWDVEGVRKSTCSAIMCAWEYCYGNKPAPGVFVKLSDYDSWTYPRKKDIYPTQEDIDELFALNIGITEASRPGKLSGPAWLMTSAVRARAPLPDRGRSSIRSPVSGGTPRARSVGARMRSSSSGRPEARSI